MRLEMVEKQNLNLSLSLRTTPLHPFPKAAQTVSLVFGTKHYPCPHRSPRKKNLLSRARGMAVFYVTLCKGLISIDLMT